MARPKRPRSASFITALSAAVLAAGVAPTAASTLLAAEEAATKRATVELKASEATTTTVQPAAAAAGEASPAPGGPEAKPGESAGKPGEGPAKHGEPPKPGGKAGEGPGKPGEQKPDAGPKPVQRPDKPAKPPDPEQLKVKPDESGKVRFNFTGQPWPGVLEWLAEVSGMSLDWQELPGDFLNLNTHRSYTVREARDIINRHLLARGYTMLIRDDVISVVNAKKLDPSLVPRVEAKELASRDPYEFVKVTFALDWLMADSLVEEFKPMLSPNGKLTALSASNRLEAMDAVVNLRDVDALLRAEQSADSQERLVREFKLKYARAEDVRDQLQTLLGEGKPGVPGMPQGAPGNPEQAAQQQAMMAAMQQQQQQGGGGPGGPKQPGGPPKPKATVNLVVDRRKNSILANAPPEKMAIIAQAVEALDVPQDHSQSLLANMSRMQVYRLAGVDPEPLVKTLEEMGNLDPGTRLQVDKKNKAIIAYASLADHVTIRAVVEKLSGSERQFEVIRLRRLPADYVAGTIEFMMGGGKKKDSQQRDRWWSPWSSPREQKEENPNEFKVDADVEHNRLLLWANEVELGEVENLLVKLGEMPARGDATTVRVIDTPGMEATQELLDRIRLAWPQVAPNPLEVPPAAAVEKPKPAAPPEKTPAEPPAPARSTGVERPSSVVRLAQLQPGQSALEKSEPPADPPKDDPEPPAPLPRPKTGHPIHPAKAPAPLKVTIGPDGRLVVSCEDPQALDLFEEMVTQMAPARKEYKVFHLKYAWAYGVALNLQEFFKEEDKKSSRYPYFFFGDYGQDDTQERSRLSKRRPLKFISDPDTNTILVEGADAAQLKTIEELIKLYDQAAPTDSQSVRKTETVHLKYSKAKVVAETVKEVYRDLLSSNDKALVGGKQAERETGRSFYYVFGDSDSKSEQKTPKFKGLLSIGVDELSNTLVVSAPAFLFEQVHTMIEDLDKAAAPTTTVQVVHVGQGVSAEHVQEVISDLLGNGASNRRRAAAQPPRRPQQPQQQMQGRGGQGRQGQGQGQGQGGSQQSSNHDHDR